MSNPWVFGDEYLYLSKAYNLRYNLNPLTDTSLGHKYSPLYSYLLALGFTHDSETTYRNVQLLNILITQILLLISFWILNRKFHWTKNKQGKLTLILMYSLFASSQLLTGYHFVAMSENLYLPLLFLVNSLIIYLDKNKKSNFKIIILISFLSGLCILTRTIGLILIPCLILTILLPDLITYIHSKKKQSNCKEMLTKLTIILVFTVIGPWTFNFIENLIINKNSQTIFSQHSYSVHSYLANVISLLRGNINWFWSIKITGNHLIYLMYSSFFLPCYFYLKDFFVNLKKNSVKQLFSFPFLFLSAYTFFSFVMSFFHSYGAFANNPIKYSTYFRYFDPAVLLFSFHGWLEWTKLIQQKKLTLQKNCLIVFILLSVSLILLLPSRDFYITINSLGWTWLDLLKDRQNLIKLFAFSILFLFTFSFYKRKIKYYFYVGFFFLDDQSF